MPKVKKFLKNLLGFIGFCLREKMVLISLVGYILILISPMFSWYSYFLAYTGVEEAVSYNIFQLGVGQIKEKSYIIFGVFIILISLAFITIEYLDYKIKLRSRLGIIVTVEILLYVALIVILVMAFGNEVIRERISYANGEIKALEYWIKGAQGHCNNGLGPGICIAGLIIAAMSKIGIYIYYFVDRVKDSLTTKKG